MQGWARIVPNRIGRELLCFPKFPKYRPFTVSAFQDKFTFFSNFSHQTRSIIVVLPEYFNP